MIKIKYKMMKRNTKVQRGSAVVNSNVNGTSGLPDTDLMDDVRLIVYLVDDANGSD